MHSRPFAMCLLCGNSMGCTAARTVARLSADNRIPCRESEIVISKTIRLSCHSAILPKPGQGIEIIRIALPAFSYGVSDTMPGSLHSTRLCTGGNLITAMRTGTWIVTLLAMVGTLKAVELPRRYFELLEAGSRQVETRLEAEPTADLDSLEKTPGWKHFGYSILAPAVLYTKRDPANPRYHDPKMLALTVRIGDLLASENEKGKFTPRLDSDWDTYTWLEACRLLESELGPERREQAAGFEPGV